MTRNILPPDPNSAPDFRLRDRLNNWTGFSSCRLLEWSSWYNQSIRNRLIGHYRLYKHFKMDYEKNHLGDIPVTQAYILQYRTNYFLKSLVATTTSFIFSAFTRLYAPVAEYAALNRHLIYQRPDILQYFLAAAESESDFETALDQARQSILSPTFLNNHLAPSTNPIAIQYNDNRANIQLNDNRTNNEFNDNRTNNQFNDNRTSNEYNDNHTDIYFNSQVILQPTLREGAQGKEKGVFSKKQHFMFFDLLAESACIERIDLQKPTKFQDIADLFHAISGKSASSFKEELDNYRNSTLYTYYTPGERDQLIRDLTNLANAFRTAGFRSIAKLAERKIEELETSRKP
jgi:hypothetical protein